MPGSTRAALGRLAAAVLLVLFGGWLWGILRPEPPMLPTAIIEVGHARPDGSAIVTCVTVGEHDHLALVRLPDGATLSAVSPSHGNVEASFTRLRRGPLSLVLVSVTFSDVRTVPEDGELACLAMSGGFAAAASYATPAPGWRADLEAAQTPEHYEL